MEKLGLKATILITGAPGLGKTTLFKRLVKELRHMNPVGFYTEEIRKEATRKGFTLTGLDGRKAILAHVDLVSNFRVGKYGVDVGGFEAFLDPIPFLHSATRLIMIDEIGKMECYSDKFKKLLIEIMNSEKEFIATIAQKGGGLIAELKKRSDIQLLAVTRSNRDGLVSQICSIYSSRI